jgi:predicted RNase H-like HicB family nuclease
MPAMVHYDSYSDARAHLKDLLDAAERGRPATVRREDRRSALVDAERLRPFLAAVFPSDAQVVPEAGGWSAFLPGAPIAADGDTFEDAIAELVGALREYAEDWVDHLAEQANHRERWGLVQLINLSDDAQLRGWLMASAP